MGYKVAIVGATGNVGREMLSILEERQFPVDEVHAIASRRSMGVEVSFGDRTLKCQDGLLPDVGGLRDFQGMVAEDRRHRLHRHR
jgi:aspartate-semialdehyde dehydrogenase